MSSVIRAVACALALPLALASCATAGVDIVSLRPAAIDPRGGDRLVLVDGEGRRTGRAEVADLLREEVRGSFYSFDDRGDDGVKLLLVGKTASVEGQSKAPRTDEIYVRIDVLVWEAAPVVLRSENEDGVVVEEPGIHGRADLQITVADATGVVLLREKEYRGLADVVDDGRAFPERVIAEAARGALRGFLAEITPTPLRERVQYDVGDPGQKKVLDRAAKEPLKATERSLRRYLKKNENNAIAMFNIGVALDAQGRFEDALQSYDSALDIVVRAGWRETRAACAGRLAAFERVYGKREKPTPATAPVPAPVTLPPAPTAPPAP